MEPSLVHAARVLCLAAPATRELGGYAPHLCCSCAHAYTVMTTMGATLSPWRHRCMHIVMVLAFSQVPEWLYPESRRPAKWKEPCTPCPRVPLMLLSPSCLHPCVSCPHIALVPA